MKPSHVRGAPPQNGGVNPPPNVVDLGELHVLAEVGPDGVHHVRFPPDPYVHAANTWWTHNFVSNQPWICGKIKEVCADMWHTFAYNHEKQMKDTVSAHVESCIHTQEVQAKSLHNSLTRSCIHAQESCEAMAGRCRDMLVDLQNTVRDHMKQVDSIQYWNFWQKFCMSTVQSEIDSVQTKWYALEPRLWFLTWMEKALSAPGRVRNLVRSLVVEVRVWGTSL